MLRRLRIKFVAIMMSIFTLMLLVIFGLILHFTQENYVNISTELMRNMIMESKAPGRPDGHRGFLPYPHFFLWYDKDGTVVSSGGENYFDLSDQGFLAQLISDAETEDKPDGLLRAHMLRYMRTTMPDKKVKVLFMDASYEMASMENLVNICFFVGAVGFVIFFGLSVFLAHITVKPVERAWDEQRQFVADASHELKTPLAVISTNAELLSSDDYGPEDKARFAGNISLVTGQMRSMVEGLLELARADNGSMRMTMEDLDMTALVSDAILIFEVLYYENGLSLEAGLEENISIRGSRDYIAQVIEILLDNAMKYSHPGSTVKLRLERQCGSCLLSVENQGEEISQEDLKNIFKRFYRTDKARTDGSSYGLGLAIAESIVKDHKGRIWAESHKGTNTFFVRLPM